MSAISPLEPAAQPLFEPVDLGGQLVGGDEDLLAGFVQGVEGVEELLHGLLLVAEELDVVEQQDVALLAVTGPELRHPVLLEGVDQVVRERLRGQVHHVAVRVLPQCVVSHGVHEVRLAQATPP